MHQLAGHYLSFGNCFVLHVLRLSGPWHDNTSVRSLDCVLTMTDGFGRTLFYPIDIRLELDLACRTSTLTHGWNHFGKGEVDIHPDNARRDLADHDCVQGGKWGLKA